MSDRTKGPCLACGQTVTDCLQRVEWMDRSCCKDCAHDDVERTPLDALAEAGYRVVEVPAAWPHRAVGGNEANQFDRIHGCCVVCLVPWPCPSQVALDEAVLLEVGADVNAWWERMVDLGWSSASMRSATESEATHSGSKGRSA